MGGWRILYCGIVTIETMFAREKEQRSNSLSSCFKKLKKIYNFMISKINKMWKECHLDFLSGHTQHVFKLWHLCSICGAIVRLCISRTACVECVCEHWVLWDPLSALLQLSVDTWQVGVKLWALRSGSLQGQNTPQNIIHKSDQKTETPVHC